MPYVPVGIKEIKKKKNAALIKIVFSIVSYRENAELMHFQKDVFFQFEDLDGIH